MTFGRVKSHEYRSTIFICCSLKKLQVKLESKKRYIYRLPEWHEDSSEPIHRLTIILHTVSVIDVYIEPMYMFSSQSICDFSIALLLLKQCLCRSVLGNDFSQAVESNIIEEKQFLKG